MHKHFMQVIMSPKPTCFSWFRYHHHSNANPKNCHNHSYSYSATAHILPEDVTISFTGSTSGPTILPNNVIYTPSNPSASLILSRTTFGEYRLNLVYPLNESPSSFTRRWPTGTPEYTTTAYVGSSSFPLTLLA